jgi:hypothetical protein
MPCWQRMTQHATVALVVSAYAETSNDHKSDWLKLPVEGVGSQKVLLTAVTIWEGRRSSDFRFALEGPA